MKKILTISILFLGSSLVATIYGQTWLWGHQGTDGADIANCVAVDNNGNAYLAGSANDSISFGSYHLSGFGAMFLVKYDSNGNIQWALQSNDSSGYCNNESICSDDSGNIYVAGSFDGTAHFGSFRITSNVAAPYLVKYSPNGNPLWVAYGKPSGLHISAATNLATDDSGNVYITGYFGLDTIQFGSFKLANDSSSLQLFIVKYNSSGAVQWAKTNTGHNGSFASGFAMSLDSGGNIFLTANFNDRVTMGSFNFNGRLNPYNDIFIVKLNPSGNVLWGTQSYSQPTNGEMINGFYGGGLVNDASGNLYYTGSFKDTVIFAGKTLIANTTSWYGALILAKFDNNGNLIWIKTSSLNWGGSSLSKDKMDNIYLSCASNYVEKYIVFNGDSIYLNKVFDAAAFMKLDTAGNVLAGIMTCTGGDDANSIVSSTNGKYIYVGGDIDDTITFGNNHLNWTSGQEPPFIARLQFNDNITTNLTEVIAANNRVNVYPNPSTGKFTFQLSVGTQNFVSTIEIYNVLGEKIETKCIASLQTIDLSTQPNGVYFYRVLQENGELVGEGKLIIER